MQPIARDQQWRFARFGGLCFAELDAVDHGGFRQFALLAIVNDDPRCAVAVR